MATTLVRIQHLITDERCYETVRQLRWPEGVQCPHCASDQVIRRGRQESHPDRQRYQCHGCEAHFDDLTDTVFEGHHQPLKTWMLCLYFMGLNLSNDQIAHELDINSDDVYHMPLSLRHGVQRKKNRSTCTGKSNATKRTWWQGTKAMPPPCGTKGAQAAAVG
jgi:transposase-like protein